MTSTTKRLLVFVAVCSAIALAFPSVVLGAADPVDDGVIDSGVEVDDHKQHGGEGGHLPPGTENVDLIGKLDLTDVEGGIADVGVFGDHAYLNAWAPECPNAGVHVADISDPSAPTKVGFLPADKNSYPGEGIHVIRLTTPKFNGDLLLHNNEACDSTKPFEGGTSLWDVSDPTKAKKLASGAGDRNQLKPRVEHPSSTTNQSHSVFGWDAGSKGYAVLVDNEEALDVDILDITDPRSPRMIAEFDLNKRFPQIVQPDLGSASSFLHDMVVKKIGGSFYMLLSYWDGGYVVLNVDDPTNPTYVTDSDFTNPDPEAAESDLLVEPEGNAHQAEFSKNNDFVVAADEDFAPYSVIATNTSEGEEFEATQGSDTPAIDADTSLSGDTVFVGRACSGDSPVPTAPSTPSGSQIAAVERGACTFTEKVANVEAAGGYEGVIIFNSQGSGNCDALLNMSVKGNIPALFVSRPTGFDFFGVAYDQAACEAGTQPVPGSVTLGTVGDSVHVEAVFDGWGYAHLFSNTAGKLTELDTYAVPEAHDPAFASGFGDLSIHEVAMSGQANELAYFSYYAAGFRVARIEGGELVERGHFIDEGGNNFWGVQVFDQSGTELVAASDRDFGLYIFEYTGPGSPNIP